MNHNTRQQQMGSAQRNGRGGFILLYTVLILSVVLITGGIVADTVMKEVAIARDEAESLKAFYAADAGVECVRYFSETAQAFDTRTPQASYNCGVGGSFVAGGNPTTIDCEARNYSFTISGFSNGACAVVNVSTVQRVITVGGSTLIVCDTNVVSNGRNTCAAGASKKLVERTRWETI